MRRWLVFLLVVGGLAVAGCAGTGAVNVPVTPLQLSLWPPAQVFADTADVVGLRLNLPYGRNQNFTGIDLGFSGGLHGSLCGIQANLLMNAVGASADDGWPFAMNFVNFRPPAPPPAAATGMQLTVFANAVQADRIAAVQLALCANTAKGRFRGCQVGVGNHITAAKDDDDAYGFQVGFDNHADHLTGVQCSFTVIALPMLFEIGDNSIKNGQGLQVSPLGLNHSAESLSGLQVGLGNTANRMTGAQVGFFNFSKEMSGVQIGVINVIRSNWGPFKVLPLVNCRFGGTKEADQPKK